MGHHYVPQRYLRNFQDNSAPGSLWLYDKRDGGVRPAAIKSVSQVKKFYPPEVEARLACEVEVPGSKVIAKLIDRAHIDAGERRQMAMYMAVMWRRVPRLRRKVREMFPGKLEALFERYRGWFRKWAEEPGADREFIARRAAECEAVYVQYSIEPPVSLWDQLYTP